MPDAKTIGKNIKNLREENNILQEDLAKKLGVTQKAVSAWENGKACPRMGAIERMEQIFHCDVYAIINDHSGSAMAPGRRNPDSYKREYKIKGKEDSDFEVSIEEFSKEARLMAELYDDLSVEKQKKVLMYMLTLEKGGADGE